MEGGRNLGMNWRRPPGRPRKTWIQQIGNGIPSIWPAGDRCGRVQMNVDIVGSRRNGPQLSTHDDDDDDDDGVGMGMLLNPHVTLYPEHLVVRRL